MYIIQAESRITGIITYFIGQVITYPNNKYGVEAAWSTEKRFATMFSKEPLADAVADVFRAKDKNVLFTVGYIQQ